MKIFVTAKTRSKNPSVQKIDAQHYIVAVRQDPHDGQANIAIIESLAAYLGMGISHLRLAKGFSSKEKVIEII